jgi:hypothetical protein
MSWSQLIYDITFCPGTVTIANSIVVDVANLGQLLGGIGAAIFSNVIALVVLYVIWYKRSVDIIAQFKWYCVVIAIFVTVEFIIFFLVISNSSYNYLSDIALLYIYYYSLETSV